MKIKFVIGIILASAFFIGCKNDKATTPDKAKTESGKKETVSENFKVTLNVVAKKNDDFQLYYIENIAEPFSEEKSIWLQFKGSDNPQDVVFNLPKDIIPASIRLDFGMNQQQEDIKLNSINMNYFSKNFSLKGAEIGKYFEPLEPSKIDFVTGIINAKDKSGKRVEPVMQPLEPLGAEISKLTK